MFARSSPQRQLHSLAWICFCGPGLFNALTSFASGLSQPRVAFAGNALVYLSFALSSLLAAAVVPAVGLRRSLTLGASGYVAYTAALWNVHSDWFAPLQLYYAACVILGAAAGFLWTAQGIMLLTYSRIETRGTSVSRFWVIFNLGATAGGMLSFALNFSTSSSSNSNIAQQASSSMYAAFLLVMAGGVVLAWTTIDDVSVYYDSDRQSEQATAAHGVVATESTTSSWRQAMQTAAAVASSRLHAPVLLALLPLFAYSNWFYAYHAFYNVAVFNARTSGLTSTCYWLAQIGGAVASGRYLDRHVRGQTSAYTVAMSNGPSSHWAVARRFLYWYCALAVAMWTVGWYVQDVWLDLRYDHRLNMDIVTTDASRLLPVLALYVVYGLHDAVCQVWIYWFMSLVAAHDTVASSCYAGVYKSVQATSAAAAWYIGAIETAPLVQLQINFALCVASVVCAAHCCFRLDTHRDSRDSEATSLLVVAQQLQ